MSDSRTTEMVCIACPIGCRLTVTEIAPGEVTVTGNKCKRGDQYGREEYLAPKRTVTATAAIESRTIARIPVKTDASIAAELIDELLRSVYALSLRAPVKRGAVLIENFRESGVNVVATRTVEQ